MHRDPNVTLGQAQTVLPCTRRKDSMPERTPRAHIYKRKQRKLVREPDTLQALQILLDGLRRVPSYQAEHLEIETRTKTMKLRRRMMGPTPFQVWNEIGEILCTCEDVPTGDLTPDIVRRFNRLAAEVEARFSFRLKHHDGGQEKIEAALDPVDESSWHASLVQIVWGLLQHPDRKRLKRCANGRCKSWFIDLGKNRNKRYCSDMCKWRYWSRSQRRIANHKKG
jgi:hypothetical protein